MPSAETGVQSLRMWIQAGFTLLTLWIGTHFILFVNQLERGTVQTISRPPGVEAFLPISALISLKYFVLTGIFTTIHPSALVLLLIILATGIFLKKGFCSWVCPVGFLSEALAKVHRVLFKKLHFPFRWIDYPLRSLKYLLLLFFLWSIFFQMNVADLRAFINSPYNRVADIKMLKFFADMSITTFWVLVFLFISSFLIPYFWCRYLCPYGALVGALSWLSPFKIRRTAAACIDCKKCTDLCPANISVHRAGTVISDECHACFECVDVCPVNDTLFLSIKSRTGKLPGKIYAAALVFLFILGIGVARLTGYWQNSISREEYRYHMAHLHEPQYNHNRGSVPEYVASPWQENRQSDNEMKRSFPERP